MIKYISILRGINVSGQKKIRMADLKLLYESMGFYNVTTYIQSGNVVFDTSEKERARLKARIEKGIAQKYGFDVPVILRTHHDMDRIIKGIPFKFSNLTVDGTKIIVTFLASSPSENGISAVQQYVGRSEKLVIKGMEAYLYCPNGYGKTNLSNTLIEQKLTISATSRNWNTVLKLHDLSCPKKV